MIFWLRFSLRSCLRRRRRTVITLMGISFGVATLIVLGAIMVGVNDTMVENAVALRAGHVVAESEPVETSVAVDIAQRLTAYGLETPLIREAIPRCYFPALLWSDEKAISYRLCLVEPEREKSVSPVPRSIVEGRYIEQDNDFIVGKSVASELGAHVGDSVVIMAPGGEYSLEITGVFETGVAMFDQSIGFVPMSVAAQFRESQVTTEVAFFCPPGTDLALAQKFVNGCDGADGLSIMTWREKLPEVAQLVDLNKFAMRIVVLLVVAILGFGVANALLISVMDRYRCYAILKAIGVRPREVVVTVIGEAVIMCLSAGIAGTLLGMAATTVWGNVGLDISHYTSFNPHFAINSVIYPRLTIPTVIVPQLLALLTGVLASAWPAAVAARRSVASGMRDL